MLSMQGTVCAAGDSRWRLHLGGSVRAGHSAHPSFRTLSCESRWVDLLHND
jgi:hypothetical protein